MSLNKTEEKKYLRLKTGLINVLTKAFPKENMLFVEESHEYFFTDEQKIFETFDKQQLEDLKKINYLRYIDGKYMLKLNALSNILHELSPEFKTNVVIPRVIFKNKINNLVQAKKFNNIIFLTEQISNVIKDIHYRNNKELKYKNIQDKTNNLYDIEGVFSKFKLFNDIFGFSIEEQEKINQLKPEIAKTKIKTYLEEKFSEEDQIKFMEIFKDIENLEYFPVNYLNSKSELENRELISNDWAKTNLTATEKGTIVHLILEDQLNNERKDKKGDLKEYLKLIKKDEIASKLKFHPNYNFINEEILNKDANEIAKNAIKLIKSSQFNIEEIVKKLHEEGFYPIITEFRAFNIESVLAGTMDILLINVKRNEILIGDWKTNKILNLVNPFQKLNGINKDNTNLNHYSFQLSTYATMLKNNTEFIKFLTDNKLKFADKHLILHVTQDKNQAFSTMTNHLIEEQQFTSDEAGNIVLDLAKKHIKEKIGHKTPTIRITSDPNIEIILSKEKKEYSINEEFSR